MKLNLKTKTFFFISTKTREREREGERERERERERWVHSTMFERHDWSVATVEGTFLPEVWIVLSSASISHLPNCFIYIIHRGRSLTHTDLK